MNRRILLLAGAALAAAGCARARAGAAAGAELRTISRGELRVTLGEIAPGEEGRLLIEGPKVRAVLAHPGAQAAELRFRYLGPSAGTAPLASGELRRQIGLKLRAQDGCNLVYAMWRIEPQPGLVVSVKRNPGQSRSRECGAGGYRTLRPEQQGTLPALVPGEEHRLAARIEGEELTVEVDGALAWRGRLGREALGLEGPVGLRSDNGRFELELRAP